MNTVDQKNSVYTPKRETLMVQTYDLSISEPTWPILWFMSPWW